MSRLPSSSASLAATILLLAGTALAVAAGVVSAQPGESLYRGRSPLSGKIRGHDDPLPPEAIVCANCHNAKANTRLPGTPAPQLSSDFLQKARQRHGGPPSSYTLDSFCRLLRTGADPGYVLIAREMPVYELDDQQCASLWTYLVDSDPRKSR